jgi:hypothetical protein
MRPRVFQVSNFSNISEVFMFCPKCSRQQISDNIRFCSGCGFQLNVVKALLVADDGSMLPPMASESIAVNRSRRKRDMRTGAALMCIFALHTAWTTEDLSLEREYTSLIVKCFILCALINIVPVIRDYFSGDTLQDSASSPKMLARLMAKFKNKDQNHALPAAYGRPAADYFTGRITTAELLPQPPPSVTEDTTNLLRNN